VERFTKNNDFFPFLTNLIFILGLIFLDFLLFNFYFRKRQRKIYILIRRKGNIFQIPNIIIKKAGWYEMENYDHCNGVIHVVEKGDTLYKLSKHYKCNLCDIITANPYVNVYNMQEGEEICIPIEQEGSGDGKMHYTVKKGDTFESVFMYFGVGPQELFENNKNLYQVVLPEELELVVD
jgi:LysM repeat protein